MNVLFLVVDDLRTELGCYGHQLVRSPHIDALAQEGLVFERAYCQQAVCAPSRCSVLSGCRPDTTAIYDLKTPLRSRMPEVRSLPEHFRRNGYTTVSIGKVYHHPQDDLQGWSEHPIHPEGKWYGRGYLTAEGIKAAQENDRRNPTRKGLGPAFEAADVPDNAYHDGMVADAAIEWLRQLQGERFFLAVGFLKPHLPFNAPQRYWDLYDQDEIALAPNPFPPEGVTPYSLTDFGELRGYYGMPEQGPIPDDLARQLIHGYLACVSYTDAQIGRVVAELRRLGLHRDTAIIVWGDHGWKLGEHGSWCKHTNFEIDTRSPMLISVPGMNHPGSRTRAPTEFVDMYPSLCELCELPLPGHLEGKSFIPLLEDPKRPWKKGAFSQYPRGQIMGYTVRTERYRYTEWREERGAGEAVACELYDHEKDAQENRNAAQQADYAAVKKELSALLQAGWQEALPQ